MTTAQVFRPEDPRVAAFCSNAAEAVFTTVVHPGSVCRRDPVDVPSIHQDARQVFATLVTRAPQAGARENGKILLVRGTSGSGKTHLLRAFRAAAHSRDGCAGYFQMMSQTDDYTRYVLAYLIDALGQPFDEGEDPETVLVRLSRRVLASINYASEDDKRDLCAAALDTKEVVELVERLTNFAIQEGQFDDRDLDLIRVLLFILSTDKRLKSRVMKWLRCEELNPADRALLGELAAHSHDGAPLRMIAGLGRVTAALGIPLVLLADQLEETFDFAAEEHESGRRFRQAVDSLVNIAAHVPNAVVVVACLDNYYEANRKHLPQSKLHRLEEETRPITLKANRSADEIALVLEHRLRELFAAAGCVFDEAQPLFPFKRDQLLPLAGQTFRKALLSVYQHHQSCARAGSWLEPDWAAIPQASDQNSLDATERSFTQLWSDYLGNTNFPVPDEEDELAKLLAWAITGVTDELPGDTRYGADPKDRFVEVKLQRGTTIQQVLVAVCDRAPQRGGLKNQLEQAKQRGGETPVVFVRSTEFPKTPTAEVVLKLRELCGKGGCRKVVVEEPDWRAIVAFQNFSAQHRSKLNFADWRRADQPLASLRAVRKILGIDDTPRHEPPLPPTPPLPPGPAKGVPPPLPPAPLVAEKPAASTTVPLGRTRSAAPVAVELEPKSLCRHAAFLGGSGSGKTTAALAVIEHLLRSGVPTVLLDRKGDLARYADPTAWDTAEPDTARAAARTALRDALDVRLFTPGEPNGCPLAVPVVPPDFASFSTADREQAAQSTASAIGAMLDYKGASKQPRVVILQKALEALADVPSGAVSLGAIQKLVSDQDEALVSRFDGQFEDRHFKGLAEDLLVLNARHRRLFEGGERLSIDLLLGRGAHAKPGRTRLSIVSTQFLGDATTVDFWVSQLLIAAGRWAAKNPGPDKLQGVFMFDEADVYLPAVKVPATKGPMENLLKRARSAGIGLFLATQSPGDLDYKCRDQITTWLIGRIKEKVAIDKLKPTLEAKPGAADKLADQKAGEFYLVREGDVQPIQVARNLMPTEQVPEDRILALARAGCDGAKVSQ